MSFSKKMSLGKKWLLLGAALELGLLSGVLAVNDPTQQLHPEDPWLHVIAGDLYLKARRTDDAKAAYLKALAIAPRFKAAQIRLDRLKAKP